MTIYKADETQEQRPVIDLRGPDGNAFVLIAKAKQMARQVGFDEEHVVNKMKASDYENLVEVFDYYFGEFVDIYR